MAEASVSPSPSLPSCCRPDSRATSFIQLPTAPCYRPPSPVLEPLPPPPLPPSPSPSSHHQPCLLWLLVLLLYIILSYLPFLPAPFPSFLPRTGLLLPAPPSCPPTTPPSAPPPPPDSGPSLFLAHRPRLPPSSLPPPPLPLPPSHLSRHCRRAPGVPQTLFSTIKLLSLPLPGSCKNNLG